MAVDPNIATFGGAELRLNPQTGVLTWDGSEIIVMRVNLINRLFGRILKIPAFSTLLRDAGISAGNDYAIASLRQEVPRAQYGPVAPSPQATLSDEQLKGIWEQMNEQDAFSGWGKAQLVAVDNANHTATLRVTQSFTGRQVDYWIEHGYGPESGRTKVCSFLEGYFLGEARILLDYEELTCEEVACQLDGHSAQCEFLVRPVR